jgi:mRNA interferase HigB
MRVISRKSLREFWEDRRYADAEQPLKSWFREAEKGDWASPAAVKAFYHSASILRDNRVVFNIAGNKYRLIVKINYAYRIVYIRFVGTHRQYDEIDANEV